jgi:hypothetical protein
VTRPDGKYGCSLCLKSYERKGVLVRHFVKHKIGGIYCPFNAMCRNNWRLFDRWDHFRLHLRSKHPQVVVTDATVQKVYREYLKRGNRVDMARIS